MTNQRGLTEKTYDGIKRTYISVSSGRFVKRLGKEEKPTDKAVSRVLKKGPNEGKTVWEEFFEAFSGELIDIKLEDGKFGKVWEFYFDTSVDETEQSNIILKLPYSSGYAKNILYALPNCLLKTDMRLRGYCFKPENSTKEKMGISVYEIKGDNFEKVPPAFTKENPNGLPQMQQIDVDGEMKWTSTKQMQFLTTIVDTKIRPKLKGAEREAPKSTNTNDPMNVSNEQKIENFENDKSTNKDASTNAESESNELPF